MSNKNIPENAIDRFFFKIGQSFINTGKTIKESKLINKTIVKPLTVGPLAVILWYIIIFCIIGLIASLAD